MRTVSRDEIVRIAEDFNIEIDDTEAETVAAMVNSRLEGLDAIDGLSLDTSAKSTSRTWETPSDDQYNAISTVCSVPPTSGSARLLEDTRVGIKDSLAVAGVPLNAGSQVMRGFIPTIDATVVTRLRNAGATITAKTNVDEFAASARGEPGYGGLITNPHDPSRSAGGSSGGSAAAVAADQVDVAIGSDTGGSIRIPASFCGVVGLKPSYGLVPLTGGIENTYTMDHLGPITETVREAARVLEAIAGDDPDDPATLQASSHDAYRVGGYTAAVDDPRAPESVSIGVLEEGFGEGVSQAVEERTNEAIDLLADRGIDVETVSIETMEYVKPIKNLLSYSELAAYWRDGGAPYRRGGVDPDFQSALSRRMDASSGELNPFFKAKLLAGARLIDSHHGRYYAQAQAARDVIASDFAAALSDVDALLTPTMPDVAPPVADIPEPEEAMHLGLGNFDYGRNTRPANVTRLPAISLPNGTADNLPVGIQLIATRFAESGLLGVAKVVETVLASTDR